MRTTVWLAMTSALVMRTGVLSTTEQNADEGDAVSGDPGGATAFDLK
jgi:hypothetical protein